MGGVGSVGGKKEAGLRLPTPPYRPTPPTLSPPIVISANPNVNSAIKYGNNKTEATLKDILRLGSQIAQRTK